MQKHSLDLYDVFLYLPLTPSFEFFNTTTRALEPQRDHTDHNSDHIYRFKPKKKSSKSLISTHLLPIGESHNATHE